MKSGGALICSGILAERSGEIETAFADCGLTVLEKTKSEGWAAFAARARANECRM